MSWTILITDDNKIIRNIVRLILENQGHAVFEAVNGLDALSKVNECHPDLIIMDVMMPEMDGLTACKNIKSNEATAKVPIVILSANTSAQNKASGYEAGAEMYLEKPVVPALLNETICNILS